MYISLEPYSFKLIIDNIIVQKNLDTNSQLIFYFVLFILIRVTHSISAFGIDALLAYIHPNIKIDITASLLNNLWYHTEDFYNNELSGSLSSKISTIQDSIKNLLDNSRRIFRFFCEILFACLSTSFIHPLYILAILSWTFVFIVFGVLFSSKLNKLSYQSSKSNNETFGKILDVVLNIFTVKIFNRYDYENKYISLYLKDTMYREKDFRLLQAKSWIVLDIFCLVLSLIMIIILIQLVERNLITTGDFTFIVMISASLTSTVFAILEQFEDFINNIGSAQQSLEIFFEKLNTRELTNNQPLQINNGSINFCNVSFEYDKDPIFKNLSISINAGEKVGLIGTSGSGKSTFVKLILRIIECTRGTISIDGFNINDISGKSIMEAITYVQQDPLLFHRSIIENIRYGNLKASNDKVLLAAKKAYIHDFISTLPDGYNTLVGERGIKLSGGQRQRIAIARAFLKSSKILIMDEATSSLDTATEKEIQKSLLDLTKNKTSIIITHRLSTVSKLDRILVFDQGKIVEDGNPSHLQKQNGLYNKLWAHSVDGLLPEHLE
jgi:ATP-binding cassette subfamily B protein